MKKMIFLVLIIICVAGCKKKSDQSTIQIHLFKGIVIMDDMGQPWGTWGTEDGDWSTDKSWTQSEYDLLNFPDSLSLTGTFVKDTTGWNIGPGVHERPYNIVTVFPNPANDLVILIYRGLGLLKMKAVIVDQNYNRMFTFACKDSTAHLQIDLSDTTKFKSGTIYRLFYSLSAKDSLNFYKGHGDILICRNVQSLNDCEKYVP